MRFGAHATVSLGRGLSAQHQRALLTMAVSDDRAARAWLGNQYAVPAVQPAVAPTSVEEDALVRDPGRITSSRTEAATSTPPPAR